MVILGLGSNLEDRLSHLRYALELIKKIPQFSVEQVSPVYISDALLPEDAPVTWDTPYLNLALRCETQLSPYELLKHTKEIEKIVGRKPEKHWGPRVVDIDLLVWDDIIQYDKKLHIPHECLHERPFALWPLADVAPFWIYPLPGIYYGKTAHEISSSWKSRFDGNAPFHTRQIRQRIDTPQLVGVLNITPDSFSDGGKFSNAAFATQRMRELVDSGAEVIDIGAEATGPTASPISAEQEWQRLEPVLKNIFSEYSNLQIKPKISVDTRHADIAKKALNLGVHWINDVSGLQDPALREILISQSCDIVVMHNLGIPEDRRKSLPLDKNPADLVFAWAEQRLAELEKSGISSKRIIFDMGVGYGKIAEQSLELIKHIDVFKQLKTRLLVGHSRKSFLKLFTDKPAEERDLETVIISLFLAKHHVDYLRIHNVEMHAHAFQVNSLE